MLDKLAAIEEKYEQINRQLFDPEVVNDMARYKKLMQEEKRLAPIVEKFREYKKAKSDLDEAKELLHKPSLGRGKTIAHLERQHPYWSRIDAMKYIGFTDEAIREYNKNLLLKRRQP